MVRWGERAVDWLRYAKPLQAKFIAHLPSKDAKSERWSERCKELGGEQTRRRLGRRSSLRYSFLLPHGPRSRPIGEKREGEINEEQENESSSKSTLKLIASEPVHKQKDMAGWPHVYELCRSRQQWNAFHF